MGIELLTSILRIKTHVEGNGGCYLNFHPTALMIHFDPSMYSCYQIKEVEEMF